jgi:hypothetical protein
VTFIPRPVLKRPRNRWASAARILIIADLTPELAGMMSHVKPARREKSEMMAKKTSPTGEAAVVTEWLNRYNNFVSEKTKEAERVYF